MTEKIKAGQLYGVIAPILPDGEFVIGILFLKKFVVLNADRELSDEELLAFI